MEPPKTKCRVKYWPFKGWEPQIRYTMGLKDGVRWFPLNANGYWLEPEAFNEGIITKHNYFSKIEAKRICLRATAINQHHIMDNFISILEHKKNLIKKRMIDIEREYNQIKGQIDGIDMAIMKFKSIPRSIS